SRLSSLNQIGSSGSNPSARWLAPGPLRFTFRIGSSLFPCSSWIGFRHFRNQRQPRYVPQGVMRRCRRAHPVVNAFLKILRKRSRAEQAVLNFTVAAKHSFWIIHQAACHAFKSLAIPFAHCLEHGRNDHHFALIQRRRLFSLLTVRSLHSFLVLQGPMFCFSSLALTPFFSILLFLCLCRFQLGQQLDLPLLVQELYLVLQLLQAVRFKPLRTQ